MGRFLGCFGLFFMYFGLFFKQPVANGIQQLFGFSKKYFFEILHKISIFFSCFFLYFWKPRYWILKIAFLYGNIKRKHTRTLETRTIAYTREPMHISYISSTPIPIYLFCLKIYEVQ